MRGEGCVCVDVCEHVHCMSARAHVHVRVYL